MKPDNKPTIIFFLPSRDKYPIGGYKIVYEYANRFAAEGYPVSILYPYRSAISLWKEFLLKRRIKDFIRFLEYIKNSLFHSHKAGTWFPLNPMIKKHFCFRVTEKVFKNYSENTRIIATAIRTSFELNSIKKFPESQKYYFVQGFENWNGVTADTVYSSYSLSLTKITIAPWLQEKIKTSGNSSYLVYNGFDFNHFRLTNPIDSRSPYEIAALYHMSSVKRWSDVFSALQIVKETIPELHVTLFGTPEQPDLPEWCSYFRCPDKQTHNQIYNNASIFVAASESEGMALPPAESMICGCALCCTNIGGFPYAIDHKTALKSPVYDIPALADNIIKLINDQELRTKLAKAGNEYIRQFTWERAYSQFKEILQV